MKHILKLEDFILESNIALFKNLNDLTIFNKVLKSDNIEGGFLTKKESENLQKEIESHYSDYPKFGFSNDIRQFLFNYDNPIAEKDINGVNLRITQGLIEGEAGNRRKTYLLYASGKIVGKFYKADDIKNIIKYIESFLIKNIN